MKSNAVIVMSFLAFSVGFAQQKKTLKDVSIYTTAKNQTEKFVPSKAVFRISLNRRKQIFAFL